MNVTTQAFVETLGAINNGDFLGDLDSELVALVKAVQETRKAGKLTVTFNIKPTARDVATIAADFSSKKPEEGRPETTFFMTPDGRLQREDPKQAKLPLRDVPMPERGGSLKIVD